MRSNIEIKRIANGIYAELSESFTKFAEVNKSVVSSLKSKSVDEQATIIKDLTSSVESIMAAARVDDVGLPKYLSKVSYSVDSIDSFTLSIRSKLKSAYKYRKDTVIAVGDDLVNDICKVYTDCLYELFYIEQAYENVKALNEKIDDICAENEIPYRFSFVVEPDSASFISSIDNDMVVFNASVAKAHEISSLGIFQSGDEYNDFVCKEATEKLIQALKSVQTPVQLIKTGVELIKTVTGVSSKKRADKLIRGAYHRQAQYLNKVKSGIGYYSETVDINGESVSVFALVKKTEDGDLEVVLNPFDIKTLFVVDFDVIAAVKAQMQ